MKDSCPCIYNENSHVKNCPINVRDFSGVLYQSFAYENSDYHKEAFSTLLLFVCLSKRSLFYLTLCISQYTFTTRGLIMLIYVYVFNCNVMPRNLQFKCNTDDDDIYSLLQGIIHYQYKTILAFATRLNSLRPNDAYMRQ